MIAKLFMWLIYKLILYQNSYWLLSLLNKPVAYLHISRICLFVELRLSLHHVSYTYLSFGINNPRLTISAMKLQGLQKNYEEKCGLQMVCLPNLKTRYDPKCKKRGKTARMLDMQISNVNSKIRNRFDYCILHKDFMFCINLNPM